MKHILLITTLLILISITTWGNTPLLKKLEQIKEISNIKKMEISPYKEYYEFWYEQPIDHEHPEKGTFKQRVLLGHRSVNAPVVTILEGYEIYSPDECELSNFFKTNQLTIEHRFFKDSKPQGEIPWEYLTLRQAATDQHRIIQTLKENIYTQSKWISTGISKGGQSVIYHRYFYPEDVHISVPYVAPMNLEAVDPRLEKFLSEVGDAPRNGILLEGIAKAEKWQIHDFQQKCFENLDKLVPRMQKLAKTQNYTFNKVGGIERAVKFMILEFPFSYWQWGKKSIEIPPADSKEWDSIFSYLITISSPEFFNDNNIEQIAAFYYTALTETGMYDYNIKAFKKYFKEETKNRISFRFALPQDLRLPAFNVEQLQAINKWLQTKAEKILFIYGGKDPWSATAVDLKKNNKCARFIKADANHSCRINHFENMTKNEIMRTLASWMIGKELDEVPDSFIY